MTIQDTLHFAHQQLSSIDESNIIIYSILSHCLKLPKEYIWAHPDTKVTQQDFSTFAALINRAANHEPLAYIIGEKEFYGSPFFVTQDVLIPRPESELIIERVNKFLQPNSIDELRQLKIVDVGTGSGCLAISIALLFPQVTVYAIDISRNALNIAKKNAARHNATNVTFLTGSILEPLQDVTKTNSIDIIVANLPYISDSEYTSLPPNVKHFEPELALRSGNDPDVLNRKLITQSQLWLKPNGLLFYETTNGKIISVNQP